MARQHDIRLRRSNNANAIPTSGNLNLGELAINTADGALYFKKGDNTIITAADNTIFHIDSDASNSGADKKIGIGTTSPNYKLSVNSGTSDWPLHVKSTDDKAGIIIQDDDTTVYVGAQGSSAFLGSIAGTSVNNLNVNSNGNIGLGIVTANLQSAGKGIHIHDDDNSEIKFTNSSTGNQAGDGTALVTSTTNFSINNREAGSLIFGTSNLTRATITSSGFLGIGTTSPASNLHVHAGSGGGVILEANANTDIDFRYRSNGSNKYNVAYDASEGSLIWYDNVASTRRMTLSSAGNIGIGTSAPATKLHIANGSDTSDAVRISGGHASRYLALRTFENNSLVGAGVILNASSSGGAFKFQTTSTDRMTIANDGKVGIGTTSPGRQLHVQMPNLAAGTGNGIRITDDSALMEIGLRKDGSGNRRLAIFEDGGTYPLVLQEDGGNVGIGRTSPRAKLDVNGSINIEQATSISLDVDTYTDTAILIPRGSFIKSNTTGDYQRTLIGHNGTSGNGSLQIGQQGTSIITDIIMYPGSSGNIRFYGSGSEDARFDSSGNLLVGTTNAANASAGFRAYAGGNGAFTRASTVLDLNRLTTDGTIIQFQKDTSNVGSIGTNSGDIYIAGLDSDHAALRFAASPKAVLPVTNVGALSDAAVDLGQTNAQFKDIHLSGNVNASAAYIDGYIYHTGDTDTYINYSTDNIILSAGGPVMHVKGSGKVGIGTSSPSRQLTVQNSTNAIMAVVGGTTGLAYYTLGDSDDDNYAQIILDNSTNKLQIQNGGGTGIANRGITLDSSENVGIGTSSPGAKLEILSDGSNDDGAVLLLKHANNNSTDVISTIKFANNAGTAAMIQAGTTGANNTGYISFHTDNAGSSSEKVRILSDGNTIFGGTSVGDAGAMSVKVDGSYTDLYLYGAGTSQGGRIFFGDSSDRSSIVGTYGTGGGGKLSFKTDTTGGTSQDRLVIDSDGSIRFNNAFTFPTSIGSAGQVLKVPNSGSVLVWADQTGSGGSTDSIADADDDTKIQVEESADEDIIRFDIAGTESMVLSSTGLGIGTTSPDVKLHLEDASRVDIKFEKTGSETHYIRKDGDYLRFRGHDDSTVLFELQNNTNGSNVSAFPNGNVGIGTTGPSAKLHIVNNSTGDTLLLSSTEASSSAAPVLTFNRDSASPANADYLGQLKFKGENDADQDIVYAKITAKIQDVADGSEDGLIEFANKKAGSNVITARLRSDSLQLLNGTGLTVAGDTTISGNLTVNGTTTTLNTATLNVEDKDIVLNYGSGDTTATADGAGIIIQDAVNSSTNAAIQWNTGNDRFNFTHGIRLPDSQKMQFGTGSDLEIQHNGTNSSIVNNTGNLIIENASDDGDITFYTDNGSGGTTPYLAMDGGNTLTRVYKTMLFQDSVKASFGNSEDMRIKHDGSNGSIDNYTGDLLLRNNTQDEDIIFQGNDGGSTITALTLDMSAQGKATFYNSVIGTNAFFQNVYITASGENATNRIDNDGTQLYITHGGSNRALEIGNTNGEVKLKYATNTKLETKSDGVDITGELQSDSLDVDGNADISGNLVVGGKETAASFPLMVKSDTSHQGLHIEENSGAESWQMGVDADGDLKFYNSGSTTPSITFDDSNNVGIGESPRFKVSIKTPAIPSGSSYAWPFDLSRPNTENRGLTFGIAASGTTNAIAGHNADVSIGHTYGTDSNGLPQYYETLRIKHVDQNSGYIGIGETNPVHRVEAKGTDAALVVHNDGNSRGGIVALASQLVGFTSTSVNDDLVFGHAGNPIASSAFNEKMRIDNGTGNVSIGTSGSGAKKLDILDAGDTNGEIIQIKGGSNYGAVITYHRGSSYSWEAGIGGGSSTEANIPTSYFGIGERAASGRPARFLIAYGSGNVGIGVTPQTSGNVKLRVAGAVRIEEYTIDTTTTSTSATTQVAIHEFPIANFRTARFTIQITNTTDSTYHSTEIIAVHDGTTANITEFGEVHTGSSVEATFDADISSSNFRLLATPTSTNGMEFKVVCHSIQV